MKRNEVKVERVRQDSKGGDTRVDSNGGEATETFDTPIPRGSRPDMTPGTRNSQRTSSTRETTTSRAPGLRGWGSPTGTRRHRTDTLTTTGGSRTTSRSRPEANGTTQRCPSVPEGWRQVEDGTWDFYPGAGNKVSDDELKAYFDKYEKGTRVHRRRASTM